MSTSILKWATECLVSKGYSLPDSPEIILQTPWSTVVRFATSKGTVYLKQTPTAISQEPKIMQLLADELHANVPMVLAINDDLHCFLMKDAGLSLRSYLKANFQPNLLYEAIKGYGAIQRTTENYIEHFFSLRVPDWRVDKLPQLYDHIINQVDLLKDDGLTDKELQLLKDLSPRLTAQCKLLAQYQIPPTIAIYDINTNNVLIDANTQQFTYIDLGEAVITHPFFSLQTYLYQATLHHPVKESDQTYHQIQEACLLNWSDLMPKSQLLDAFVLAKTFWPIYSVLSMYRLINIIGLQAFKTFYANRPNRLAGFLRDHIHLNAKSQ